MEKEKNKKMIVQIIMLCTPLILFQLTHYTLAAIVFLASVMLYCTQLILEEVRKLQTAERGNSAGITPPATSPRFAGKKKKC